MLSARRHVLHAAQVEAGAEDQPDGKGSAHLRRRHGARADGRGEAREAAGEQSGRPRLSAPATGGAEEGTGEEEEDGEEEEAPPPDALLPYSRHRPSSAGQCAGPRDGWLRVLPDVLSEAECSEELERMWRCHEGIEWRRAS